MIALKGLIFEATTRSFLNSTKMQSTQKVVVTHERESKAWDDSYPFCNNGFVLLVGPPGTGKSYTVCTMITRLYKIYDYDFIYYIAPNWKDDETLRNYNFRHHEDITEKVKGSICFIDPKNLPEVLQAIQDHAEVYEECMKEYEKLMVGGDSTMLLQIDKEDILKNIATRIKTDSTGKPIMNKYLIVADDASGENLFVNDKVASPWYQFVTRRRHFNTQIIGCVHSIVTFRPRFRQCVTEWILKRGIMTKHLDKIYEELGDMFPRLNAAAAANKMQPLDMFKRIYSKLTGLGESSIENKKYNSMLIFKDRNELWTLEKSNGYNLHRIL